MHNSRREVSFGYMENITIEVQDVSTSSEDCHDYEATASRAGLTGRGFHMTREGAIQRAKENLIKKESKQTGPGKSNWENCPEAMLAEIKIEEICPMFAV